MKANANEPSDWLTTNFSLIVVALDGAEHLAQRTRVDHVLLEFTAQSHTAINTLCLDLDVLRDVGEQIHHRQRVVHVVQRVSKRRITIAKNLLKRKARLVSVKQLNARFFISSFELCVRSAIAPQTLKRVLRL